MAITSAGYFGAVDDVAWAQLFEQLPYWCRLSSFVPTAANGVRRISLTAGVAFGAGIRDAALDASTVSFAAPSSGGVFYLVVLRHTWAPGVGGTTDAIALPGATTDGNAPSVAPTALPDGFRSAPGDVYDVPIAWVHVRAADATLVLYDVRMLVTGLGIASASTLDALRLLAAIISVPPNVQITVARDGIVYRWDTANWLPAAIPLPQLPSSVQTAVAETSDGGRLAPLAKNMSNGDWNNALDTGFYRGSQMANAPDGTADWHYVEVIAHDPGSYRVQIAHRYTGNGTGMYRRSQLSGNWTAWDYYPSLTALRNGDLDTRYYTKDVVDSRAPYDYVNSVRDNLQNNINSTYSAFDNGRIDWRTDNLINSRGLSQVVAGGLNINAATPVGGVYQGSATISLPGRISTPGAVLLTVASSAAQNSQATVGSVSNGSFVAVLTRANAFNTFVHWLAINTFF